MSNLYKLQECTSWECQEGHLSFVPRHSGTAKAKTTATALCIAKVRVASLQRVGWGHVPRKLPVAATHDDVVPCTEEQRRGVRSVSRVADAACQLTACHGAGRGAVLRRHVHAQRTSCVRRHASHRLPAVEELLHQTLPLQVVQIHVRAGTDEHDGARRVEHDALYRNSATHQV